MVVWMAERRSLTLIGGRTRSRRIVQLQLIRLAVVWRTDALPGQADDGRVVLCTRMIWP